MAGTYIDFVKLSENQKIRDKTKYAVQKAARDVLGEAIPSTTLDAAASSGQDTLSVVSAGIFWIGAILVVDNGSGTSEEVVVESLSTVTNDIVCTTNLVNSYSSGHEVRLKNNNQRTNWAMTASAESDTWLNIFVWDVVTNATIQSAGEDATDADVQYVVNSSINRYAKNF